MNESIGSFENYSMSAILNFTFKEYIGVNISKQSDGNLSADYCDDRDSEDTTCGINITDNLNTSDSKVKICDYGFHDLYTTLVPGETWILFLDALLALVVVILNSILISVLLRKSNISVVNIFLSVLGFSDACCAIFMCLPVAIGTVTKDIPVYLMRYETFPGVVYVLVLYPFCSAYSVTQVLSDFFHTMSCLITTCMCFIKALIMLYPIKSRIHITQKVATIVCSVILFLCLSIYFPFMMEFRLARSLTRLNACCRENLLVHSYRTFFDWFQSFMYLLSFFIMIVSSVYISLKLTILRAKIQQRSHSQTHGKTRKAALIVLMIVLVYILSEAIFVVCLISKLFTQSWTFCQSLFAPYQPLIQLLGFTSNFIIYSIMGEELRNQLYALVRFRREKSDTEISVTNSTNEKL